MNIYTGIPSRIPVFLMSGNMYLFYYLVLNIFNYYIDIVFFLCYTKFRGDKNESFVFPMSRLSRSYENLCTSMPVVWVGTAKRF